MGDQETLNTATASETTEPTQETRSEVESVISEVEPGPDREQRRLLKIRKKQELKLVKKFDKSKINVGKECWYLIDSNWLNAWASFVNGDEHEDIPGPLSTKELLDEKGEPLPGLKAIRDYRGVPPIVYFIFFELYGTDGSTEITRYLIDIYKSAVPIAKLVSIQLTGRTQAKIHVNKVRPKWIKWEREYSEDEDDGIFCCCGLSKEHLEAFIYWAITCWARRKSGRANISYRKYKPLRSNAALKEEEEELEKKHQEMQEMKAGNEEEWLAGRKAAEKESAAKAELEKSSTAAAAAGTNTTTNNTNGSKGSVASTTNAQQQQQQQKAVKKAPNTTVNSININNNQRQRQRRGGSGRGAGSASSRSSGSKSSTRNAIHRSVDGGNDDDSSSSSSSDDDEEGAYLMDAPADMHVEKGQWLKGVSSKYFGFW
mmetsp:Transcript_3231/g.5037  ORF Transcript_3231/g.5037 Transcript_3231/m.5037 type:complete len:429 (-) Transcript_3231:774-2060(-)